MPALEVLFTWNLISRPHLITADTYETEIHSFDILSMVLDLAKIVSETLSLDRLRDMVIHMLKRTYRKVTLVIWRRNNMHRASRFEIATTIQE